jgi:SAM-dependent methyltransferase
MSQPYYGLDAIELCEKYEIVDFRTVHKPWLPLIPSSASVAIDIGCGSGRDAGALSKAGLQVLAVDSSPDMLREAERLHSSPTIEWLVDALPQLPLVLRREKKFDLVLLSAVWMHLLTPDRRIAMGTLSKLCDTNGIVVISLRRPVDKLRGMIEVSDEEISALALKNNLEIFQRFMTKDALERSPITWSFNVLRRIIAVAKSD